MNHGDTENTEETREEIKELHVILSAAKDLAKLVKILRCAQDDMVAHLNPRRSLPVLCVSVVHSRPV
jgi:hypothetical protein